jgi:GntR family transcriptional regulator/MocR family aminotransferase
MHVSAIARPGIDCEMVGDALAKRGIMVHSLSRYYLGSPDRAGFIIGYAAADLPTLELAVDALADELERYPAVVPA